MRTLIGTLAAAVLITVGPAALADRPADPRIFSSPVHGRAAVDAAGDRLPELAARNHMSAAALRALLLRDETMWLSHRGDLFVREAKPPKPERTTRALTSSEALAPLEQTFALHSRSGSPHVIYLDFDGTTIQSDHEWAKGKPAIVGTHAGWNPQGSSSFDDAEKAAVQEIWARVAEDFAPFDVDVTTEDPGAAALSRSSLNDPTFGTHVGITQDAALESAICNGCGGVAWVDVIDEVAVPAHRYEFAWVFAHEVGHDPGNIAEAISHEVGHTFSLVHDGTTSEPYYSPGESDWSSNRPFAPIMGASYYNAVSQWSKADYPGGFNAGGKQDDVAIIRQVAGAVPDPSPSSITGAPGPPAGAQTIGSRTDTDVYSLGTCTAGGTVTVAPASVGANLDVVLTIVNGAGTTLQTSAPGTSQTEVTSPHPWAPYLVPQAVNLGASVTLSTSGALWAVVDGGGGATGSWATDYDDYGSLGQYTMTVTGCTALPALQNTAAPTVTGTSTLLGATLGSTTGTWTPAPTTTTRQWLRNGAPIAGATGSTYVLGREDVGSRISLRVTVTRSGYSDTTATSAQSAVVQRPSYVTVSAQRTSSSEVTAYVTVTVPGVTRPTGTLTVLENGVNRAVRTLTSTAAGKAVITFAASSGAHTYTVRFVPSVTSIQTKTSSPVTVP